MKRFGTLLLVLLVLFSPAVSFAAAADYALAPAESTLTVTVWKKGTFSAFLHDHFFKPEKWDASAKFDPDAPGAVTVKLTVESKGLHDTQEKLSESDRAKVDRDTHGDTVLAADANPEIRFEAFALDNPKRSGDALTGSLNGSLTIRGQTKPKSIPVSATISGDTIRVKGSTKVKQTDFGITPISKLAGSIQVKDAVTVEFDLVLKRAAQP